MSKHLETLSPEMKMRMNEVVRICAQEGVEILVYCGLRTMEEQAKLYRQSRGSGEINHKRQSYIDRDLPFLAEVLDSIGPQAGELGKHVTKAGPGESWHQYRQAADCVPLIGGKAIWDDTHPAWEIYGFAARYCGLTWAGDWKSFREMPHVQLQQTSNPITSYKLPEAIKEALGL